MTLFEFCLGLGFLGLAIMAAGGLVSRGGGRDNDVSNVPLPGHHGATHSLPAGPGASSNGGAGTTALATSGARGGANLRLGTLRSVRISPGRRLLGWLSPRVLFSVLVGFGATGMILNSVVPRPILFAVAAVVGLLFEAALVGPIWRFIMSFGSEPAQTLEHSVFGEARAVSSFDANGQGLISIELDGQVVQVLGTLRAEDRVAQVRVRSGDPLVVEEVDAARNRCTVSRRDF